MSLLGKVVGWVKGMLSPRSTITNVNNVTVGVVLSVPVDQPAHAQAQQVPRAGDGVICGLSLPPSMARQPLLEHEFGSEDYEARFRAELSKRKRPGETLQHRYLSIQAQTEEERDGAESQCAPRR